MATADTDPTVARIASEAPPLSEAQRARLAALLRPSDPFVDRFRAVIGGAR